MYSTVSSRVWLIACRACCCTTGFALNAMPSPAWRSMSKSLAPSPTATTCSLTSPSVWQRLSSKSRFRSRLTIAPVTRPVSVPSRISNLFAKA